MHSGSFESVIVPNKQNISLTEKVDREGGRPLEISIKNLDINGFTAKQELGGFNFIAPCIFHGYATVGGTKGRGSEKSEKTTEVNFVFHRLMIFSYLSRVILYLCIVVFS